MDLDVNILVIDPWPDQSQAESSAGGVVEATMQTNDSSSATPESIGQAINRLRTEKGLGVNALAKAVGFSNFSIHRWEQGKGEPNFQSATVLDAYFGSDLVARFGVRLRGAPISRFIPLAQCESGAVEQNKPQTPESVEEAECSNAAEVAAAEQNDAAASRPVFDQLPDDQVIRVLSGIADTLMTIAGGLSQIIKTLREVRR
jgi:DNA-binding transcriptional regulator YiaG